MGQALYESIHAGKVLRVQRQPARSYGSLRIVFA